VQDGEKGRSRHRTRRNVIVRCHVQVNCLIRCRETRFAISLCQDAISAAPQTSHKNLQRL